MVTKICILMIIGFLLLLKGADFLVKGATEIAKRFNISEMIIGILIVGIGTSLPEIIITIKSALEYKSDILIGNGIGSSICNILLVVGISSICRPVKIDKRIIKIHFPISIISVVLLGILCNIGKNYEITKMKASILIFFTVIYVIYTVFEGKKDNKYNMKQKKEENLNNTSKNNNNILTVLKILIGMIFLKYGADLVVDGATKIAQIMNISEAIISMTIIAVGTTLPEIITSVIASFNKKSDLALGNVIGSNIFNICLLPGIGGLINPIKYDTYFNISLIFLVLIVIEVIIAQALHKKYIISRKNGMAMGILYFLYTWRLLLEMVK